MRIQPTQLSCVYRSSSKSGRPVQLTTALLALATTILLGLSVAAASDKQGKSEKVGEKQPTTGTISGKVDSKWVRRTAAVVYVKEAPGEHAIPKKKLMMDQKRLTFIPHVLPVLKGSTVAFPNNDTVRHNVFAPARSAKQFNLGLYPAGSTKDVKFDKVGVVPLLCNVHSEMSGFVLVLQNPYFATTDKDGNFTIKNIPQGKYELRVWHDKLKSQHVAVPVVAGKTTKVTFKGLKRTRRYEVNLTK